MEKDFTANTEVGMAPPGGVEPDSPVRLVRLSYTALWRAAVWIALRIGRAIMLAPAFVVKWRRVICAALAGLAVAFACALITDWVQGAAPVATVSPAIHRDEKKHDLAELVRECAPGVAPNTMLALMRTESQFNTLALHVNADLTLRRAPQTRLEAIAWSKWLISQGYSVDLGLMQINSRNLARLQMSVADAFEPCRNMHGAAVILLEQYKRATQLHVSSEDALLAAISAYNTGNFREGFRNGYVSKVLTNAKAR